MHVDELGGKVQVALKIACIYNVDDNVGSVLDDLLAHIKFFWRVGRKRICARKVNNIELIAFEFGMTNLGIDSNTRVVAYTLVSSRGKVEERSLATIRIAYKRNINGAAFLHSCIA